MSSEEMRIELESFVNTGLREGWHGWPRKGEARRQQRLAGRLDAFVADWLAAQGGPTFLRRPRGAGETPGLPQTGRFGRGPDAFLMR